MTIPRLASAVAFVALALAVSGCTTSGTDPASVPSTTSTTPPSLSEALEPSLTDYCRSELGANFTGSGEFMHPTWGQSLLATCLADDGTAATALIVDHVGLVQWHKTTTGIRDDPGGFVDSLFTAYMPLQRVTDQSGNLFITYDTDSFDGMTGVEVLRPTEAGAESIGLNLVEWGLYRMEIPPDASLDRPLFANAIATYDTATNMYRIEVGSAYYWGWVQIPDLPSLVFEWTGSKYQVVLGQGDWFLDQAVSFVGPFAAHWEIVNITGSHVTAILCASGGEVHNSTVTCNGGFTLPAELSILTGELDETTAVLSLPGAPDSPMWGILHLDADGVPQSFERPAGTECRLADGSPYTGDFESFRCVDGVKTDY